MLNTQSRAASWLVWLAVAVIAGRALWTWAGLEGPEVLAGTLLNSELAAFVGRNQAMITGLVGFGGLAFAYLLNGWRDRTERRHAGERAERRLAEVLAREAQGLALQLAEAAKVAAAGGQVQAKARLAEAVAADDRLLLSAPMTELARLGAGAATAIQAVRRAVRRLAGIAEGRDDQGQRPMVQAAVEATFAAHDAVRVLETLTAMGTAAADRIRLLPRSELEVRALVASLGEPPSSTRLLPAA